MDIFTVLSQNSGPYDRLRHLFCEGIPGSDILPLAFETHDLNPGFVLNNSIVKAYFLQCLVFIKKILITGKIYELMGPIQHVLYLICENTTVPQCPLTDISLCGLHIRLFLKGLYTGNLILTFGNDISVLFGRECGLYTHKYQICLSFVCLLRQISQGAEIVIINIGIHRTYHHRLFL